MAMVENVKCMIVVNEFREYSMKMASFAQQKELEKSKYCD
jgi:hypothetical protein